MYDDPTNDPSDIRAGQPVLLYHNEIDGFFTARPFHSDSMPAGVCVAVVLFARARAYGNVPVDVATKCSEYLWVFQCRGSTKTACDACTKRK